MPDTDAAMADAGGGGGGLGGEAAWAERNASGAAAGASASAAGGLSQAQTLQLRAQIAAWRKLSRGVVVEDTVFDAALGEAAPVRGLLVSA